jgi:hypothetical protein
MNWILNLWPDNGKSDRTLGSPPTKGELIVRSEDLDSFEKVHKALSDFDGDGWVTFTDRVENLNEGQAVPDGVILSAERVNGDRSLHIRQHGSAWRAWTYERTTGEACEGWLFTEQLERIPRGSLVYEVEWRADDDDGVFRPKSSRLKQVIKQSK